MKLREYTQRSRMFADGKVCARVASPIFLKGNVSDPVS